MSKIVVIAAHPDDEVLGVGGTIPLLKKAGDDVTVLIVTDGSSMQYPGDSQTPRRKSEQLRRANETLGTDRVVHWDLPDMRLDTVPHADLNGRFEVFLREGRYDTVFVHHPHDVNLDHTMIYRSVAVATRPYPDQHVRRVFTYFVASSTEWGHRSAASVFIPNVFVDIAETISIKLNAMAAYEDELRDYPHPRSLKAIEQRAAVVGSEIGFAYAEPLCLIMQRSSNL